MRKRRSCRDRDVSDGRYIYGGHHSVERSMFARLRTCLPGKERDQESGLDYFGARYFGSSMGRWMSPDWSAKEELVPYAKLDNPQSLNLYAYVGNNPQSNSDTDGHECISHVNADSGFCVRATEYSQINANPAINSKTVFFEAAAEVSTALNSVNTNAGRLFFNSETVNVRL